MRVVFLGSADFSVPSLLALVDASDVEVVAVVCQPDRPAGRGHAPKPSPVKVEALAHGLTVLQPENVSDAATVETLRSLVPDVFVVAAYGQILRQRLLDVPARGSLNVHASLLPRHRGSSPIAASILTGDASTGVTIMEVVRALDAGPMVARVEEPISAFDTTGTLELRLATAGARLLAETLQPWALRQVAPIPQDEALATYAPQIRRDEARIDWSLGTDEIWRRVRAFNPWPVAFTTWRGEELRVLEAWPLSAGPEHHEPGTVLAPERLPEGAPSEEATFSVQTGSGRLAVLRLQRQGRRALSGSEFVRGQRDFVGERLGI